MTLIGPRSATAGRASPSRGVPHGNGTEQVRAWRRGSRRPSPRDVRFAAKRRRSRPARCRRWPGPAPAGRSLRRPPGVRRADLGRRARRAALPRRLGALRSSDRRAERPARARAGRAAQHRRRADHVGAGVGDARRRPLARRRPGRPRRDRRRRLRLAVVHRPVPARSIRSTDWSAARSRRRGRSPAECWR